MNETIGKRIAALRKEKGYTQEALANLLEVSPQAVSKWENDQACPDIALLPKLARLLDTTVDALLSGEEEKPAVQVLPPEKRKDIQNMMLRIVVDSSDGDKVRVNLPLALVQVAMESGIEIQGMKAMESINWAQILDLVSQGVIGNLVEVDSADGDIVRIFVE